MGARLWSIVTLFVLAATASEPIGDENLRLTALQTIFPGAQVALERGRRIDESWPKSPKDGEMFFPDALAGSPVYRVNGAAMNEAERNASVDLTHPSEHSGMREVRLRLFHWPGEDNTGLLAIVQYNFLKANPPLGYLSIGRLVHIHGKAVRNDVLLNTTHHSSIQRADLIDLAGNGMEELVIESDVGGAGSTASTLQIFDLSRGRFTERLSDYSRLQYFDQEGYTQVLDLERTRQTHGRQFCVTKAVTFEKGKWFNPPRITHPCYSPTSPAP
jgi:hypothetical protein